MNLHYTRLTDTSGRPKPIVVGFSWQSNWHPAGPAPLPPVRINEVEYEGERWETTTWTELVPADVADQQRGYRWLARQCFYAARPPSKSAYEALVLFDFHGGMGEHH